MARATTIGVRELFDLARIGEFKLPAELIATHEAHLKVQQATIGTLDLFDVDQAAEEINAMAIRGEEIDLLQLGSRIQAGSQDGAAADAGEQAKRTALERIGEELTAVVNDLAEVIIHDHLQPVFAVVLQEAKASAKVIAEHPVSPRELQLSETETVRKVRGARRRLEPLSQRRLAIVQARARANRLGNRQPEHDSEGLFGELQTPQVLAAGWSADSTARMPYPGIPTDPVERLVWLVTDGAPCQPWLPTVAEQDEAWLFLFGEKLAKQRAASASWGTIRSN